MRIVGEEAAQTVYDHLHALVGAEFADSFECTPSREHIRTIEGREEGFYAWIAANWLIDTNRKTEGGSDKINAGEGPVGIIDLGAEVLGTLACSVRRINASSRPLRWS
eukprot:2347672-Pyramimonas_sp.AAC.1